MLPKQPDEFVCRSCFLVKHPSQLADAKRALQGLRSDVAVRRKDTESSQIDLLDLFVFAPAGLASDPCGGAAEPRRKGAQPDRGQDRNGEGGRAVRRRRLVVREVSRQPCGASPVPPMT